MLILYFIIFSFAALFIYIKPISGLIIYVLLDTYIGMQTTNLLPIPYMKPQFALINQLIIFILLARAIMSQSNKIYFSNESKYLFKIAIGLIIWSILSITWTDITNEKYVLFQLERLIKIIFFSLTIFLTIKNMKQLKTILFLVMAAYFIQNLFQIVEYIANNRATVQGGGLSLLVFSIIMLQRKVSPALKIFLVLCILLVVGSVFLTGTRRGIGALIIILIFTIYNNITDLKFSRLVLPTLVILITILTFSEANLAYRLEQTTRIININDDNAWGVRNKLWEAGLYMISERPVFGHGFGVSRYQMGEFMQDKDYRATTLRMHNAYLKAWAELGILGLLLLVIILYQVIRMFYKASLIFKHQKDWVTYAILFGSSMQLFGLALEGFFGWSAYLDKVFWFYIALIISLHRIIILNNINIEHKIS